MEINNTSSNKPETTVKSMKCTECDKDIMVMYAGKWCWECWAKRVPYIDDGWSMIAKEKGIIID